MLEKLRNKYENIYDSKSLNKNKLTPYEAWMVGLCLQILSNQNTVTTMFESVADWFNRNGANVVMDDEGINYIISIKKHNLNLDFSV